MHLEGRAAHRREQRVVHAQELLCPADVHDSRWCSHRTHQHRYSAEEGEHPCSDRQIESPKVAWRRKGGVARQKEPPGGQVRSAMDATGT
jgi:hypothetical protein